MKPLVQPNIPQNTVAVASVAADAIWIAEALKKQGIQVVTVGKASTLPSAVACHADLQLLHLGGNKILLAKESMNLQPQLTEFGFLTKVIDKDLGNSYPNDISLNFLLLPNCCFGLCSNMPLQIKKHCIYADLQTVSVNQGYARCSVAVVSSNAAITADSGLHTAMTAAGLDVLLIESGDILLPGYNTGFIGGCCGLVDKNKLAFAGSLDCYRFGNSVKAFLEKHNVTPITLCDGKLTDIGGILPLLEM